MRKKQKDPRYGVTVRVIVEIWDSCRHLCNIVYMQKAAAQQDAWARRFVLCWWANRIFPSNEALGKLVQRQNRECSYLERNSENPLSWAPKNGLSASPEKILSIRGKNLEISRSAALQERSLQCSKWVFSVCTEFFRRPLTRGKNPVCPGKKGFWAREKFCSRCRTAGPERAWRAGAGLEGRACMAGLTWMGAGAWPDREGGGRGNVRVPT